MADPFEQVLGAPASTQGAAPAAPVGTDPFAATLGVATADATAADPFEATLGGRAEDPQRHATPLEHLMDALATGNYASAGAASALLKGEDPFEGAATGVREKINYGDVLAEHGVTNPWIRLPVGLALDIFLDPVTYTGAGTLTKAGELAHGATLAAKLASLGGDAERIAKTAEAFGKAGEIGATLAEQGAKGQRAALSFAGKSVLPAGANEAILGAADKVGGAVGNTQVAQTLRKMFLVAPELKGLDREAWMARRAEMNASQKIAEREAAKTFVPIQNEIAKVARAHGVDVRELRRALSNAVELSKGGPTESQAAEVLKGVDDATRVFGAPAQAALAPHVHDMVTQVNLLNAKLAKTEFEHGIGATLSDASMNYAFRAVRPEAVEALRAAGLMPEEIIPKLTDDFASQHRRGLRGQLLTEINDKAERGELVIAGQRLPAMPGGLYEENPMVAAVTRSRASARAVGATQIIQDYARIGGRIMPKFDTSVARGTGEAGRIEAQAAANAAAVVGKDLPEAARPSMEALGEVRKAASTSAAKAARAASSGSAEAASKARQASKAAAEQQLAEKWTAEGFSPVTSTARGMEGLWLPNDIARTINAAGVKVSSPGYFLRNWDTAQQLWKNYTLGIFPMYHTRNLIGDFYNAVVLGGMPVQKLGDGLRIMSGKGGSWRIGGQSVDREFLRTLAEKHGVTDPNMRDWADELNTLRDMPKNVWEAAGQKVMDNVALRLGNKVGAFRENTTRMSLFLHRLEQGDSPEVAALFVKEHLFDYSELTDFERSVARRIMPFYSFTRKNVPLQLGYLFKKPGALAGVEKLRNEAAGPEGLGLGADADLPRFLQQGLPLRMGSNAAGNPQFAKLEGMITAADVQDAFDPGQAFQKAVGLTSPFIKTPLEMLSGIDTFKSDFSSGKTEPMERFPGERENILGIPMAKRGLGAVLSNVRPVTELNRLNPGNIFGTREQPGWFGAGTVRDFAEADPAMRAINMVAGRVYPINADDQASWSARDDSAKVRELQRMYVRALARNDTANADILRRQIEALTNAGAGVP